MRRSLAALALASTLFLPAAGRAQQRGALGGIALNPTGTHAGNYEVTPDNMALTLMPELKNAPAPDWVKPGTRIVLHQMSATIPDGGALVEDPEGKLVNAAGQSFRFSDISGTGGHGYLVVDIVSVQADAVVVDSHSYLINGVPSGPITLSSLAGSVTTPSAVSGVYVNPTVLKPYLALNGNGVQSYPVKYKTAGKTFDAVWQRVGSMSTVFDTETGLVLHTSSSSSTAGTGAIINGVNTPIGGGTMLAQSTMVGIRQLRAPWAQGKLPAALRDVRSLVYEGGMQTSIPGVQMPPAPVHTTMEVVGRGDDFVQLKRTGFMMIGMNRNDLGTLYSVSGPSQLLPMAIDPADLANLKQGQVIDRDPVTGATTTVASIGRDRGGHDVVTLSEVFPGQDSLRTDCTYERSSGLLVASSFTNPILHQVTRVSLKSKQ